MGTRTAWPQSPQLSCGVMACALHPLNTQAEAEAEAQVSPGPSPEFLDPGLDSCTALATASPRRGPRRAFPTEGASTYSLSFPS